jgi:uncharacterized damage-inducible protein DinB
MVFDEPADLIGSCEALLDTLGLLIGDIREEIQDGGDSWTIAQILNHLLDTERRYVVRVRLMRRTKQPVMRVFPNADYTKLTALAAWSALYELRREHVRLLRDLKPSEWRRSGTLVPGGRVTITSLARHLAAHDAIHTAQITRRLSGRTG